MTESWTAHCDLTRKIVFKHQEFIKTCHFCSWIMWFQKQYLQLKKCCASERYYPIVRLARPARDNVSIFFGDTFKSTNRSAFNGFGIKEAFLRCHNLIAKVLQYKNSQCESLDITLCVFMAQVYQLLIKVKPFMIENYWLILS